MGFWAGLLVNKVVDGPLGVVGFHQVAFVGADVEQGRGAEVVDDPGDSPGVVVDEPDGAIGEDGPGGARHLEPVLDACLGFQFIQAAQVEADGDSLPQSLDSP